MAARKRPPRRRNERRDGYWRAKAGRARLYAGLILDHDLQQQAATSADLSLSGSHLVNLIIQGVDRSAAILVHSMNFSQGDAMAARLDRAGFWVTRAPMDRLSESKFLQWIADVQDLWMERTET